MLKTKKILTSLLLLFMISACTKLNSEDRKLLMSIKQTAEDAREQAAISAYNAELASEKAERIFKQSQKK